MSGLELFSRKLVLVTGKGGVGKSALTAAIARELAARGRRTLALEVDPRENLHQLFDIAPSGGEIVPVADRLHLQNLKPRDVVDWVVRKQVKVEMLVQRVLNSPVYHRFVDGAPGLKELAILGHALRLVHGEAPGAPPLDTVVLDAPATGHGLFLLTAPRLYAEAIGHGPFADMAGEVAALLADGSSLGVVVVTTAEEMPVQEALELREGLAEKVGVVPDLLMVNGLYPEAPGELPADLDAEELEMAQLWRLRRQINERELARLAEEWPGPRVDLPLLPVDRGRQLLDGLAKPLKAGLAALKEAP
jgi:anion-transporting  ArsA/GET3 family ATPase